MALPPKYLRWMIKGTIILLDVVLIGILLLPFSYSFHPDEYQNGAGGWMNDYVDENQFTSLLFDSLFLNCLLVQVLEVGRLRGIFKFTLLLIGGFCFVIASASIMPMQDYQPHIGTVLLWTVFPIQITWYFLERNLQEATKGDTPAVHVQE